VPTINIWQSEKTIRRKHMPNHITNYLTVTGPNPGAVIAAVTRPFNKTIEVDWDAVTEVITEIVVTETAYYSDEAVASLDPTLTEDIRATVYLDEQRLEGEEDRVGVTFDSAWVAPWAGVARLSKLFPENTLRLCSFGEFISFAPGTCIALYLYKAGVETRLNPRESWSDEQKALFSKYNVVTITDRARGDASTTGTIVIDGVTRNWTFVSDGFVRDGTETGVIIEGATLDGERKGEVYEAVVDVLQTFPFNK
jgi:hypothetical protein